MMADFDDPSWRPDILEPDWEPLRKKKSEDTLEPTWWILDRESGMDDLADQAGDSLKQMGEDLKIFPFKDTEKNDRLFLARFEFPRYGEDFQFPEAVFIDDKKKVGGFIDFLAGFPVDCVEMLVPVGQFSSKVKEGEESKVAVQEGKGVVAPVPKHPAKFFKWPEEDKILFNLTALATKDVAKILAKNLEGEDKPHRVHWWFRVNLNDNPGIPVKFPVPGEFLGLGVRMMPDKPWGRQKSSPFLWSGNWMDTVFYTSAVVTEVLDPTDEIPYPRYKVQWRKDEFQVNPTDFAEYRVGDRVTLLKDITTTKKTQLWKDDDMQQSEDTWIIAPISFYGLEKMEA